MRFWLAALALAAAIALLAPALSPLSGSMDAFAQELANGTFRPFGPMGPGGGPTQDFSGSLGGFTGRSPGSYLPGAGEVPKAWTLDRDGRGGVVTIDHVFDPALGAMKRLKAYDRVANDGQTLQASDTALRPIAGDLALRYDRIIEGSFDVAFHKDEPIAIFSPHPKAIIDRFSVSPPLSGGVQFFKDGADTFYALGHEAKVARLNITFRVSSDYYTFDPRDGLRTTDYVYTPLVPRPSVPASLAEDAKLVLARAGVDDPSDVGATLEALAAYFRSFTEGDIPPPSEIESLYLALALGGHGCCRHRAFAFMVTSQSVGIPTRVVVNEAHAFVEVALPGGRWHQINLGGCGSYRINDPNNYSELFPQSGDPREEANPDEGQALTRAATVTEIADAPALLVKGVAYVVNGTVRLTDGRGVPGARVDLFLNETKRDPGRLTGTGTTGLDGRFSILARVPRDLPAQGYQLVARGSDGQRGSLRVAESWSDPPVDVFAPTRFAIGPLVGAIGFPTKVTGRLLDVDNVSIPNATVRWTLDGAQRSDLRTDAAGRFVGEATVARTGDVPLVFRYDGDEHHGAATANATLTVSRGAILLPPEAPVLVRGERGILTGTLAASGVALAGHAVVGTVESRGVSGGDATTGREGVFAVPVDVGANATPGSATYRLSVPSLGLATTSTLRIAARPTLDVRAPATVPPGEPWVIEVVVASDNGTGVPNGLVNVTFDANASATRALLTNRTGVARFEVPGDALPQGAHTIRVAFAGDGSHVAASVTLPLDVARPWYASVPAWGYALLLAAAVAATILVPALRRGAPLRRSLAALVAGVQRPERRFLALAFPDHPPGVHPVFEPGETARVRVVVRDRAGLALDVPVGVTLGEERRTARTAGERGALLEMPVPDAGPLRLTAHARGLARAWTRPLVAHVDVAPYRKAVEAGFVALRERAGLGPSATPHDLVARLAPRLDAGARDALREAARLFEVADYSNAVVDRAFYHTFARAATHAREALEVP